MARQVATPGQQSKIDAWLERVGRRQHWVVAHYQLIAAGINASRVDSWIARGKLYKVHRGVYKLGPGPPTARGQLAAAVLASSPAPLISLESAVGLWGLARMRANPVHLTIAGNGSRSQPGIVVHRTRSLHPDDRAVVDGIPVTSVPRTLVDIAAGEGDDLRRAVEEAEKEGLLVARDARDACDRASGKRGVGYLRELLATLTAPEPTNRELERRFLWLCRDHLAIQPLINTRQAGWQLDAFWPQARLAVELDSVAHHSHRSQLRRDLRKNLDLADAGIDLIRLGWTEVVAHEARTAKMLSARLQP